MTEARSLFGRMFGRPKPKEEADSEAPATPAEAPAAEVPQTPEIQEESPAAPEPPPPPKPAPPARRAPSTPRIPWLQRLKEGLSRSSTALSQNLAAVFARRKIDSDALEELEDMLIRADLGVETAAAIADTLRIGRYDREITDTEIKQILSTEIVKTLGPVARSLDIDPERKPHVILVVGVNGTGKTTTIGKLAAKLRADDKKVILAAGDTFRAAAIEQLKIWGERTGAEVIAGEGGGDAAGLVFDALTKARAEGVDVLLIDTAGRLHNKDALMAELEKIVRVLKKIDPSAPHSVLLTLDATTGQNALQQADIFGERAGVTGLVMTKLDGTARGGILVAIAARTGLPVHFIGVGEGIDDLEPFSADDFAKALVGL